MKHISSAGLAITCLIFSYRPLLAAEAKGIHLDIHSSISLALKQNPGLLASDMGVSSADADLTQARSALFPRIDIHSSVMKTNSPLNVFGTRLLQESVSANDMALTTLNNPSPVTNFQNSISASLPIFSGGANLGRLDEAQYGLQASLHTNAMKKQRIIYQVIQSFAGYEAAQAMKSVAKQAVKSSEAHFHVANSLFSRGMVIKSDVLNAKVSLENSQVEVIAAANTEAQALDNIHTLLNLNADRPIEIKTGISIVFPTQSLEQLTAAALQRRPDLIALQDQGLAADAGTTVARAGMLPHVKVIASEQWNDPNFRLQHPNYQIAAMVNLNVFAGGHDKAAMDKAEAERSRIEYNIIDKRHQIENEVANAFRSLNEADQRLQSQQEALSHAQESLRITEARYKAGLARMADLLQAQTQRDQAHANVIQAQFDKVTTCARLYLATGQLTPEVLK